MERFAGTVAVVTGSSSGIGEAITKALLKKGLTVVGLATRIHKLQENSEEILKNPEIYKGIFHGLQCDIRNESEIQDVFQHIKTNIGPVSILVNNAGRFDNYIAPTAEKFDNIFDTNVRGLLLCAEEAMGSMKSNGDKGGHIININSIVSLPCCEKMTEHMIYYASKYAARSLSETMRHTVCEQKLSIKVTDISPGLIRTPTAETYISETMSDQVNAMQILPSEEIANACIFALNTPTNVLISELTIMPIHEMAI